MYPGVQFDDVLLVVVVTDVGERGKRPTDHPPLSTLLREGGKGEQKIQREMEIEGQ